jgi:hypothetical protein
MVDYHHQLCFNPADATLTPFPTFNAEQDCDALRKAIKGIGTDEKTIIDILCHRSLEQRLTIFFTYQSRFGKNLIDVLKAELSGNLEDAIVALLKTPADFQAFCLQRAFQNKGGDLKTPTEIICTRSNDEIAELKVAYLKEYATELEAVVANVTTGFYKDMLLAFLAGNRVELTATDMETIKAQGYESIINKALATQEAQSLIDEGVKKWSTKESVFFRLITERHAAQLRATVDEYKRLAGKEIFDSLAAEEPGDYGEALVLVILGQISRPVCYAKQLYDITKGLGTRDITLIRIIVTRADIDLQHIKAEFLRGTGKTLRRCLEKETSGDYKKALLEIVGE